MKVLVLLMLACSFPAAAEDWPRQKALHIVVGFAPGSTTDLVARLVAPKLSEAIGQSVILENKPGAGGNVATQLGLEWRSNTSGEFAAFLRDEVQKWAKAVKDSGAKPD